MSLLQSFIDKNRVIVSLISFIEPIASFHEIQKISKMSFNIPLIHDNIVRNTRIIHVHIICFLLTIILIVSSIFQLSAFIYSSFA